MPASRHDWRDLIPGIILTVVLAVSIFLIMRYGNIGRMRGDSYTLHVPMVSARGLMRGTPVWMSGHRIGQVKSIEFLPATTDTARRILVDVQVLQAHAHLLRRDSYAQIRAGGSLLGNPVVHVNVGTAAARVLVDGDTLPSIPQGDTEGITSQVALSSRQFPEIIANVKLLNGQLVGATGTVGALLDESGTQQVEVMGSRASALMRRVTHGEGTVGLVVRRGAPTARVSAVMAQADTLRQLLATPSGSLGQFRRDSTLLVRVGALRNEVSIVKALLDEPRGTAGRVLRDRAAWNELTGLERELGLLMADLRERPLRYLNF